MTFAKRTLICATVFALALGFGAVSDVTDPAKIEEIRCQGPKIRNVYDLLTARCWITANYLALLPDKNYYLLPT